MADPQIVVVGAGPAGLAAALAAADGGAEVTVVDLGALPGGQYLRQPAVAGLPPVRHGAAADRLLDHTRDHPRITFLTGHQVWQAAADAIPHLDNRGGPGFTLRLLGPVGPVTLHPSVLVLATGGHDRVVPFPGWDLPGVVTAGAAQSLAKGQGVLVGQRVLVAGTGPFLLTVADGLAAAGAEVAGVVEASRTSRWGRHLGAIAGTPGKVGEAVRYLGSLRRRRIPIWSGEAVTMVEPYGDRLRATLRRVDAGWRPGAVTRAVAVDAVCVGHGFTPSVELAVALGCATHHDPADGSLVVSVDHSQASTVPGVFVAGEATGVGGADLARYEGTLAGLAVLHRIGRLDTTAFGRAAGPLRRRITRQRRFATALHKVYPVPDGWTHWLRADTVLCRCEEVTVGRTRSDITAYGIDDLRALKLVTRIGMGRCQGRMCGRAAACLLGKVSGRPQPLDTFANRHIAMPVPLGTVAEEGTTP
ncbi:FAD/NAD(P)-dependent oxidoreductase [Micromonospora sp. NBC_01796]|uniref:FAD/NAD(P)-dependent oxidoreductase n=1 Tax=Micromonospora sp. NBC_01796 TaxID=2975987 RepID=UPI002DD88252|nr:NAD(P)/FAD-dependent oxidoreductase [Micromonospora sp. NBC_01796]WSA86459.1 NAD(P)/FAD-dependent oxidoreductase [Micromonospora sp. NBC_01796]